MQSNDEKHLTRSQLNAEHQQNQQPSKKRPKKRWALLVLLVFLLSGIVYGGYLYMKTKSAADKTYDEKNAVSVGSSELNGSKPVSFLLLGVDNGEFGRTDEEFSNSDTMIVATLDAKNKKMSMVSVPRDTMAQIEGEDTFDVQKVNAAYQVGGAKSSMATVSKLLNVPLKFYVEVNMKGLQQIVDAVGGVTVDVPFDFSYDGHDFKTGKMKLSGTEALAYSRMRYDDPENDYGRQKRQRQVIEGVIKNAISLNTITKLDKILDSVSSNVTTNLKFDDLLAIGTNYKDAATTITSDFIHGTPAYIDDASYQVASTEELQRVSNILREGLGLETETINNNETYQNEQNVYFDWDIGTYNQPYYIYAENNPGVLWNGYN